MTGTTQKSELLTSIIQDETKPSIVITTHHKPDGDAMGSALGLHHFLKSKGIDSLVITPTDYADFLHWLPGNDDVIIYEGNQEKCHLKIEEADLIFCLDFNKLSRVNDMAEHVLLSQGIKVLIDHHQDPDMTAFDNMDWWNTDSSSTCELIYRMIEAEGFKKDINMDVATCLYTGIMTDTGSFRHPGTKAETHRIAAEFLEMGLNHSVIHSNVWDSFSENRIKLLGYALSEKLEILPEYNTSLITLTKEELKKFNIRTGDTEGLVNYGLNINGIKFTALIIDRSVIVKMSFRSKGNFDVNKFAVKHFSGGGHINAAGGSSNDTLEKTVLRFKEALKLYKEDLS
jgi:bifunctional oligoribonuclease and PAP phosphatase NrnA